MSRKRLISLAIIFLLVVGLLAFLVAPRLSRSPVTVDFSDETSGKLQATIYKADSDDHSENLEPYLKEENVVMTTSDDSTFDLPAGAYILKTSGDGDFAELVLPFFVEEPVNLQVDPPYSENKLNSLLSKEKPRLHQAIRDSVPDISGKYNISSESLYAYGQWYGAKLVATNSIPNIYRDDLRILAQKNNDVWVILSSPPEILLYTNKYTEAPEKILIDINNK